VSHRKTLLNLLENYKPENFLESRAQKLIRDFVEKNSNCFSRSNLAGHITASCWLLSPDRTQVLLTHHKKIGRWLQLGGHCDGDPDVRHVALKEAYEESGIKNIKILHEQIFDLDIHTIAQHKNTSAHEHYDIRFVLQALDNNFSISSESIDLRWVKISDLITGDLTNDSLARMAHKWLKQKNITKI